MDKFPPDILAQLMEGPAGINPEGLPPNFVDPPSLSNSAYVDLTICLFVATLAIAVRLYTKLYIIRKLHLEDYLLVLAYCTNLVLIGLCYNIAHHGLPHQWDMRVRDTIFFLYWYRIAAIIYMVSICLVRVVILLQYLRVFVPRGQRNFLFWAAHTMIWLNIFTYTATLLVEAFPCNPVRNIWDPFQAVFPDGSCILVNHERLFTACFNVFADLVILLLPHHVIWKLKLSTRKKIGLSLIFAVGILACGVSAVRVYFTVQLLVSDPTGDAIRSGTYVGIFLFPEIVCGILIATLPVVPRFYQYLRDSRLGSSIQAVFSSVRTYGSRTSKSQTLVSSKNRPYIGPFSFEEWSIKGEKGDKSKTGDTRYEIRRTPGRGGVFWRSFGSEDAVHYNAEPSPRDVPETWYESSGMEEDGVIGIPERARVGNMRSNQ